MAILIAYCIGMKKDRKTLLNFAILAGNGKNAPFHIKLPVKNFHGRAKGGEHRTVALPLNAPLGCEVSDIFANSCATYDTAVAGLSIRYGLVSATTLLSTSHSPDSSEVMLCYSV